VTLSNGDHWSRFSRAPNRAIRHIRYNRSSGISRAEILSWSVLHIGEITTYNDPPAT